jgi:hypothetical protein
MKYKQNCETCFHWRFKRRSESKNLLYGECVFFENGEYLIFAIENGLPDACLTNHPTTNQDGKFCPAYRATDGNPSRLQVIREAKNFLLKAYGDDRTAIIEQAISKSDLMSDNVKLICGTKIRFKILDGNRAILFQILETG